MNNNNATRYKINTASDQYFEFPGNFNNTKIVFPFFFSFFRYTKTRHWFNNKMKFRENIERRKHAQ